MHTTSDGFCTFKLRTVAVHRAVLGHVLFCCAMADVCTKRDAAVASHGDHQHALRLTMPDVVTAAAPNAASKFANNCVYVFPRQGSLYAEKDAFKHAHVSSVGCASQYARAA